MPLSLCERLYSEGIGDGGSGIGKPKGAPGPKFQVPGSRNRPWSVVCLPSEACARRMVVRFTGAQSCVD